jgi:hydantoinase/carbamoylase family amidase
VNAATVMARCAALDVHTEVSGTITRRYATPALAGALAEVEGWMRDAGLVTRRDAVGNLVGRYEGTDPDAPALLTGSHLDSVPDGGRYDGPLGVLASLAVVERLAAREQRLPFPIDICAFADEESVRYGTTYLGSSALAGRFDPGWLERVDRDGVALRDAMQAFGAEPDAVAGAALVPGAALAWIELHIEQGPRLETADVPIGVVIGIQAQERCRIVVSGTAGHAGTTPMAGRRDALAAAAELVLAVEQVARETPGLVATVGTLAVEPGGINVIPGRATFTIDVRHPDDDVLAAALAQVDAAVARVARERRVEVAQTSLSADRAVPCDARLRAILGAAVSAQHLPVIDLASGAGHDAAALHRVCPVAMLFLRCAGGVSHNPAESIDEADVAVALDVLERAFLTLTPGAPR